METPLAEGAGSPAPSSPPQVVVAVEWGWARPLRQRLAAQIQEAGRAEAKHVEALVAALIGVFGAVLERGSSRQAWTRLLEVLRLLRPFRKLLSGRAELLPYLEGLCYQHRSSQALVSDLDVPGAIRQAFPTDCSVPWPPSTRATCPRGPARQLPSGPPQPVFAALPCPFTAGWVMGEASGLLQPGPVALQELQRCAGPVGCAVAQEESPWASSLGFVPLTLATDVPADFACREASDAAAEPFLEPGPAGGRRPGSAPGPALPEKGQPVTGLQAAELFVRNRHVGKIKFLYLNVAPNRHFRPYDLMSVPKRLTHPHHYVFSAFAVLHVHPEEGSEALSLGAWHREAMLWQLLQYIPFFRCFLVRKAFLCWRNNVKHLQYLKRRETLRSQLLQGVPHFGAALLHISRLLLELQSIHWLSMDNSKCFDFPELKWALEQENSKAQGLLSRFLTLCSSILELVRDDTYRMVNGLQMRVQAYKLYLTKESLYQQRMQYEGLQRRLGEAESWLQRLGLLALLVNFLICQNLVSAVQEKVTAFVSHTMKVWGTRKAAPPDSPATLRAWLAPLGPLLLLLLGPHAALAPLLLQAGGGGGISRKAVLRVELLFNADNQLMLFPSCQELEDCLLGALDKVVESILETTRIRSVESNTQESPPRAPSGGLRDPLGPSAPATAVSAGSRTAQGPPAPLQLAAEVLSGEEEPPLLHRLDLKAFGGLEVVGHRLRGQYPMLSREQLEKDLRADRVIQKALAKQRTLLNAALTETRQLCQEYSWLAEICQFVHSWDSQQLESMKGWPAEEYVNRVLKLRTWLGQVQKVPRSVVTYNCLLFVDCSGVHQELLPLLAAINEDILGLLLSETTQRSELFIAELASVLQLYLHLDTDIFTIAKCSQKLEHYQGQMAALQEYVDYVRALNEVIPQCFRPLSPSEESLENMLLDTWDAFVYQQREVSDFIVTRRLTIITELSRSLQQATRELQELLATVTVGRFRDPAQNPRAMEEELRSLCQRFQATVVRIADLCRSQRILTGDCMDVSFVTGSQGVIELHMRIWQLFRIVAEQITEWKCLAFGKFSAALALEKTEEWQKEAISMEHSLPSGHPVLQACLRAIGNFQKYLPLLLKLGSHFLKLSFWKDLFAVMGVKCPLNMQFTLGQLLSYPLLEHSESIYRVYTCEKSRYHSRDTLQRLQRAWTEKQFRLVNFILSVPYQEPQPERFRRPASGRQRRAQLEYIAKDSGTYVLSDTAELKATVEQSILTLHNMILSPFSTDIQEEAESWASTLRAFESLLDAWVSFQQKWVFLNIVLYEMDISFPSAELDSRFQRVDAHFREFMQVTCNDPLVLSSVRPILGSSRESRFVGSSLQAALAEGSADLQLIIRALDYVLEATRMGFPRLFFLSNEELVALLATASEPAEASAWAQRCFPGVRQLLLLRPSTAQDLSPFSADLPAVQVTGLAGEQGEKLRLCSPVALSRKATQWLCSLEQHMKESVFQQLQACVAQRLALRPQLDTAFERRPGPKDLPLHLVAEGWATLGHTFPAQCVLVAEEALWRTGVEEALREPGAQPPLLLKLSLKLEALAHYLRNYRSAHPWQPGREHLGLLLGALLVLALQQRDATARLLACPGRSPQAFEWARLLKYHVALQPEKARAAGSSPEMWGGSPPGCWAEALGCRLPYDYEYLGPCLRLLGSPALERTFLGLLLALQEFRCGGLLGRPGVGKSHTLQGLAQALGRQLVTLHCSRQMSIRYLSRHLCGAVHAGALLLLESAERLEPAVLSAFSQRLVDLQGLCSALREVRGPAGGAAQAGSSPASKEAAAAAASSSSSSSSGSGSEGEGQLAVSLLELGTDEAAPYQPRVLGNILFGGRLLRVRETYGCVATLGHLPEALRLALRPLAMLPPDLTQLAEVTLLAAGFREAVRLAEKLGAFFRLEGELGPGPPASPLALLREVIQTAIRIAFEPPEGQDPPPAQAGPPRAAPFFGLEEEPAVVRALGLSPLLSGPACPRLQRVQELLRQIFPSAASQPPEPPGSARLQSALVSQLHEDKLHPDPQLLRRASHLAQALLGAPGILLLGPAGSGKSTTWRALAKALSKLAASSADPRGLFQTTSTVCLWPNGLSLEELVGGPEGSSWQDGVLSRLLKRAATSHLAAGATQQWLVLDGAACPAWLEPISSLFSPRPCLSLPSGQQLQPPASIKFLFEMPDASGVAPSVCAHCALLHCGGADLWPALLASALAPVYRSYCLTQESLAMLRELAEELFPATLAFLQEHCCSVLLPHAGPRSPVAPGVQEATTFARLLHALLEHYLRRDRIKAPPAAQELTAKNSQMLTQSASASRSLDDAVPAHHHWLVRSIFVFAYIWGFGGHLHPRHWPRFDHFARQALGNSRYAIELPSGAAAFDLCPLPEDGALRPFDGRYLASRVKSLPASFSVLPQYERVLFVVELLLGTEQPVLLVGEPGCGKSSFAEMLVQPNYFYHRLCITPALSVAHLRHLLHKKSSSTIRDKGLFPGGKPGRAAGSKGRCLFLVEDLHMARMDPARETSPVIETLRQALSQQQFYQAETLELQHFLGPGLSCFGLLSEPLAGARPLCPRFGRLFSTVVLPPVAGRETLLSMHVPAVLAWLEKFPLLTRHGDLASALVRATVDSYEAVRSQLQPSPAAGPLHFSLHHLQKVFKGLFLLRPRPGIHLSSPLEPEHGPKGAASRRSSGPGKALGLGTGSASALSTRLILRLWLHEALRTFCDPLRGEPRRELCSQLLLEIALATFCAKRGSLRAASPLGRLSRQKSSRPHITFHIRSASRSGILAATSEEEEEEEGEEEEPPEEEGLPLLLSTEPGHDLQHSPDADRPDPWDPVEQAPALTLDPPAHTPPQVPPSGEMEASEASEVEEVEAGKKRSTSFQRPPPAERHRAHEPPSVSRRASLLRARRRASSKKESSGPLLPSHLLLLPGEAPRDIVFSKDLGPELYGPGAHNPYQEKLWKTLEHQLAPLLPPDFLLSSQALKQVAHLSRVLAGPERHGALVSASRCVGRRSLVALVAAATACLLLEMPEAAGEEQALALLRSVSWQAGILGRRVLLLVPPGVSLPALHLVLVLMAEGTCPGLYSPEEHLSIIQALLQENQSIKRTMRDDLILQRFFQFVRTNLHVLLLLGGPGSPALPPITATALSQLLYSMEVYHAWSYESLLEVASKHLKGTRNYSSWLTRVPSSSLHSHKDLVQRLAKAAVQIHCSASTYATHLAAQLPLVTPRSFLDFLDTFALLLGHQQERNAKHIDRMKLALHKMNEVSKKQQEHTRDAQMLQQKLAKLKEQVVQNQREVEREQAVLQQQEKECQLYEARIEALTKERDALEKKKELAMKKMSTDYKDALAALRVQDIVELRSYRQPPAPVVKVTNVLCMMFGLEPGWENAQVLLHREDFYEDLVFYPKDHLSGELFQALAHLVVCDRDFQASAVHNASHAAASLCRWIHAVYWYHWALRDWQPAMTQLQCCDAEINVEKTNLGDRRLHAEFLRDATQARIRELKQKQEHQEKVLHQLTQSLQAKEEATTMESSVAEHVTNWSTVTKGLQQHQSTVYGDALLCAAALAYLGPFPPPRREELLEKWQAVCAGARRLSPGPDDVRRLLQRELPCPGSASAGPPLLPVQQPFGLVPLLSSAQEQRTWDRAHKHRDPESRLAAVLLHSETHALAHRWPLLVDPDRQAQLWLLMAGALEEEASQTFVLSELMPDMVEQGGDDKLPEDNLAILSLTDPDLDQALQNAACLGSPVLLLDVEKRVPWGRTLQQLMQKAAFRAAEGCNTLHRGESGEEDIAVPASFRLYLCTSLPLEALAKEFDPALLKQLNVINLCLSQGALEELLLEEVLRSERREILKHRQALRLGVLQLEGKLEATEEELVELIAQPQRSLLEEENFMPMMRLLQTQIQALRATHQHMASQCQHQVALCDKYRPVARLAGALQLALRQVARLHPLYSFPAEGCQAHLRQALLLSKRPEASKQETLEARLQELHRAVLQHLLAQALPCLQERDRPLCLFLGAVAALRVAGQVSPAEWLAFCQGLQEPVARVLLQPAPSVARPGWVEPRAWEECCLLESLPGFRGLPASLAQRAAQWQEYFRLPSTVVGPAPCPSHAHLRPFQRAILWRILRPETLSSTLAELSTCLLGWSPSEEVAIPTAYAYSRANKPVIFLMPPAGSPGSFTHPLHWIQQMAAQRGRAGKVVVISFGTPDAAKRVWRALPLCTKKGKWLVLNNCQLEESWDPEVLLQLDLVLNTQAGESKAGTLLEIHHKFRLWLISTTDAPDSVPGPVQRRAVVLFCETPLELRGILARTHHLLQGQLPGLETPPRLALLLLFCTLLYRQAYARWTQAATYLWSHGDLLASFKAQDMLSRLLENAEEALQELAGPMLYGGHVLDRGDAHAVHSVCQQCLASPPLGQPEPGLTSLQAAMIGPSSPGLSEEEAAAATRARMAQLPSPMEPAWVGVCRGLQQRMLADRSQALLAALKLSQGLWQPRGPPGGRPAALEQLVQQGLGQVQELQSQLQRQGRALQAKGRPPGSQPRPLPRPLQGFLLAEGGRFWALLQQLEQDLRCTQECLQGGACSSARCAAIRQALQQGQLPRPWLPYAPAGPQPPQAWLETLQQRGQLLCHYLESIGGQPVLAYHLAAFHHPRRLLLALLEEKAHLEKQDLERYHLDQQVLPHMLPPSSPPDKGLYLSGLELRHGLWNPRSNQLQETLSAEPCPMPTVWVQASCQPGNPASETATYHCPVYLGVPNAAVALGSHRAILHVALPSKMAPELCAQQRIHLVSLLP
ncbi:dynein heavy chain domain-containing protein 1 isoform X3 [Hemicordylus capensis]|uniref:dynein heavy chain domain-containing protein 1 isoform X3 n=1 Tax=Hemicordylus capensis TaxID=884348 RepID=UPI0023030407|nr:dynein heavy chain domain-containing protein 1 isoform X3 [Hemicordylus capensis]